MVGLEMDTVMMKQILLPVIMIVEIAVEKILRQCIALNVFAIISDHYLIFHIMILPRALFLKRNNIST